MNWKSMGKDSEKECTLLEGWKEIGNFLGKYSARHTRRLFYSVKDRLKLKHWLGPGHRVKMSVEEIEIFRKLLEKK